MIEIQIMYDNFKIQKFNESNIDEAENINVLYILFTKNDKKILCLRGTDFMGFFIQDEGIIYDEWDEEDDYFNSIKFDDCCEKLKILKQIKREDMLIFKGKTILLDDWNKILGDLGK